MIRRLYEPVRIAFVVALGLVPLSGFAQQQRAAIASSDVLSQISMFNYQGKSSLELRPTPIVSTGGGDVDVDYRDGNARIDLKVKDLPPPAKLGPYTGYVLWTLTPDGRAANQGVLGDIEGGKAKLDTQYSASQFALIVTAEPHFAVSAPSNMIVLYNVANKVRATETKGDVVDRALRLLAHDANRGLEDETARGRRGRILAHDRGRRGRRQVRRESCTPARSRSSRPRETAASASKSSDRKQAPALRAWP